MGSIHYLDIVRRGESSGTSHVNLELIVENYKGKELDPMIEHASHELIIDDNFAKTRAFYQFSWRINMGNFEERCNKLEVEHPKMKEVDVHTQIKEEMMQ